ncbi:hypothetical protein CYR40_17030 [Chimaeribacter arupi]|uniref:Toxin CptA n=2 Tax=Yersiniaceae TaxID=1903411 RepID=A0A2N5EMX9_9GAMM|nr:MULTISPECIES: protein YgfX [Yersiniaceae]MBS0971316.1 hypothetical protein [Nissabacter archeti]MDV5141393.1 protein YgfX [Chimaeribacter arupi]PLR35682.1 hypothetical protein CYR23_08130 [Chimaeribacter arupi]PLR43653.1 hypothetical protein CYR40_17030 [Chimaeribacter arupi]PLR45754.1 hypothetical protein CYR52_16580 [Chimaeribacter arupi]
MAQWRCDIRVSWRTQLLSLFLHGGLILLVLLAPWPEGYLLVWLTLVVLLVFQCIRSQKNISARHGEMVFLAPAHLRWKQREWLVVRPPWLMRSGMILTLQPLADGTRLPFWQRRRQRLWLASDALTPAAWRHLCLYARQQGSAPHGADNHSP